MSKSHKPHPFEESWRKRFESFAACSDDDAGIAGWSSTGLDTRLRQFKSIYKDNTSNKGLWLDAGCGAGTYSRFIANQGLDVIGLDYSHLSVQKATKKGSNSIDWCVADINKLPLKQEVFDGVVCFGVTQALESSTTIIHELSEVTKPGGQVWIDALNRSCLPHLGERFFRWIRRRPTHLRYESHYELLNLMKNNSLVNIKLHWLPILPKRWNRFQWIVETSLAKGLFHYIPLLGLLFSHAFVLYGQRTTISKSLDD